ncbi:MAG: hypothetical protein DMG43_15085, partial [Acidobacteria bacterium]
MEWKEANGAEEAKGVKRSAAHERIAAFFDLDGTLMALPSLERRFFRILRYRQAIPAKNYFSWLGEAMRLLPSGINAVLQENKMYLRGVQSIDQRDGRESFVSSRHKNGRRDDGQPPAPRRRNPRLPAPAFLPDAIERLGWHAKQGHAIFLVTGTLEPLASAAALALILRLAVKGITTSIGICATRLEEVNDRWTGRIVGEAMFGEAKVRAVRQIAAELNLDLGRCYAYGDSAHDRWLLEAVGRPAAVNPSRELEKIAMRRGWAILRWMPAKKVITRRRGERGGIAERVSANCSVKTNAGKISERA